MTWSRRQEALVWTIVIVLVAVPVAYAVAFDATSEAGAEWEATPSGPTVYFASDQSVPSSATSGYDPYPSTNEVNITTANGIAVYSGTADTRARIDTIDDGTWSNVSQLDVSSGNLTINPATSKQAKVTGGADIFKFAGEAEVDDGSVDVIYSASGTTGMTLETDGTADTSYGLVDNQAEVGLDVATSDGSGQVVFQDAPSGSYNARVEELGTLTIRDEKEPHNKVTGANVEVRFFSDNGNTIVERTDSDNDGKIDLTGLPVDDSFVAFVDAGTHYPQRTILIEDLSQQETAFILNKTEASSTAQIEFVLDDETGNFDAETTEIIIERGINTSRYGAAGTGIQYRNVAGDDVGADRAYITTLEVDKRYRISVRNEAGDVRQLGAFTPKVAGTTTLEIGSVTVNQSQVNGVAYNATLANVTGQQQNDVVVEYNDSTRQTNTLWIEVHERGNRTNKLITNTTFVGPLGEASTSTTVPKPENDTEWVVRVTADRGEAEDFFARKILSPRQNVLPGLPAWLTSVMSLGLIWVTAGLFSQRNGAVGALVVAGMGGMFWFAGFAPGPLGIGVVILSMVTAALIFINDRRGSGL